MAARWKTVIYPAHKVSEIFLLLLLLLRALESTSAYEVYAQETEVFCTIHVYIFCFFIVICAAQTSC